LFLAISITLAGNEARLEIIRGQGAPRTIRVTVDKSFVPGKVIAARKPAAVFGLRVDYLSVLLQSLDPASHPNVSHGVIIREVQSDISPAKAFLKVNDVITHVKGKPVRNPAEFYRRMQNPTGPIEVTLANAQKVTLVPTP